MQEQKIAEMTELVFKFYPVIRKSFRSLVSIQSLPITTTQLSGLYAVEQAGSITMSTLAKKLQVSNQQLTKIVDNLVDLDLVTRKTDPDNRRQLIVAVTEKGSKSLHSLRHEVVKKLTLLSRKVDTAEMDKLYESLMHLSIYFDKLARALDK